MHHCAEIPESHLVRRETALELTTLARTAIDVAREAVRLECALAGQHDEAQSGHGCRKRRRITASGRAS